MQASPSKNSPCPCGSGKKFKRCCGKDQNGQSTVSIQHEQIQNIIKLYQQGNLQAAGHLAKQQLARHPDDVGLIEMNAVITLQTGDTEQAVRLFKMQLDVQPDNALAHSNLCMALHSLNRDEEAFQHGQQAIDLDPYFLYHFPCASCSQSPTSAFS